MPLFSKQNTSFRDSVKDFATDKYKDLNRILKNPGRVVGRRPEFKGGTTVVFLPYPNFENPNYKKEFDVLPDRLSDNPMDYSPWMFIADGVAKVGKTPVTILFDDPDDGGWNQFEHNPMFLLYYAVSQAVKKGQLIETPVGSSESDNWELLLNGDKDKSRNVFPCLEKPDQLAIANAIIYSSGTTDFHADGAAFGSAETDPGVVFVMKSYLTTQTLCPALDAIDPKTDVLKYPDVTGCQFVHFYDRKGGVCTAMRNAQAEAAAAVGLGTGRRVANAGGQQSPQSTLGGFGVHVTETSNGLKAGPRISRADAARLAVQRVQPWEKVLRGHTPIETAQVLADHTGLPASMFWYAWKSMPEYYTDELKRKFNSTVSANVKPGEAYGHQHQDDAPGAQTDTQANDLPAADLNQMFDPDGAEPGMPTVSEAVAAYDQTTAAEAQARFRAHMAGQSAAASARSAAAKPQDPNKTDRR